MGDSESKRCIYAVYKFKSLYSPKVELFIPTQRTKKSRAFLLDCIISSSHFFKNMYS